ncbi:MAG: hypothetical protein ACTSWU_02910, partial [Candidatus Thorarchaeota archaeon]
KKKKMAANITRTERERCLDHYGLTVDEWEALDEKEKQEKVDGLPAALASGKPKTDVERCIEHFFDGDKEKWDALTDKEKEEYIKKLPKRGSKLSEAQLAQHYFQISNEMFNRFKPEIQEIFIDEMKLEYFGEDEVQKSNDSDRIDWLEYDVQSLYKTVWDNYDEAQEKFDRINQRINDIIALIGGRIVQNQNSLTGGKGTADSNTQRIPETQMLSDGMDSEGYVSYQLEDLNWTKLEDQNVYKISGTLIAEGTWTGIDGHTVFYPREVIEANYAGIVGKTIKRGHGDKDDDVIGFVTAAAFKEDRAIFEGIIFDALTIEDIGAGDVTGTSMEALVKTKWDADRGNHIAQSMRLLKATVVKKPACKTCNDLSLAGTVALEDTNGDGKMSTQTDNGSNQTPILDIVNLSDGNFYETLEENLLSTELSSDAVKQFMSIIRGIVRVSDKISRMRFVPDEPVGDDPIMSMNDTTGKMYYTADTGESFVTANSVSISVTNGWDYDNNGSGTGTWIWPTTTDKTITWIPYTVPGNLQDGQETNQDGDQGQNKSTKDSDIGDTEMSTELENMKAELADVKTKLTSYETEKADLETKLEAAQTELSDVKASLESKDELIAEKDGKLAALSKELEDIKKSEVVALEAKIKEIQEDFDKETLLGELEDLDLQKKMLASYFETASKLKKTTKLGVDDRSELETRAEKILAEMGFSDVKSFIERK